MDWAEILKVISQVAGGMAAAAVIGGIFKLISDKQAHKHRIREMMTSKMLDYTEKFYLPMLTEAEGFRWSLEQEEPEDVNSPEIKSHFRYMARYFRRRHEVEEGMSGYILHNVSTEKILSSLETKVGEEVIGSNFLSRLDLASIITFTTLAQTFYEFNQKLSAAPSMDEIFSRYKDWRQQCWEQENKGFANQAKEIASCLSCYDKLLEYEISNVLEKGWHEKVPPITWTENEKKKIRQLLDELIKAHLFTEKERTKYEQQFFITQTTLRKLRSKLSSWLKRPWSRGPHA